jgi:hypothetical protein
MVINEQEPRPWQAEQRQQWILPMGQSSGLSTPIGILTNLSNDGVRSSFYQCDERKHFDKRNF